MKSSIKFFPSNWRNERFKLAQVRETGCIGSIRSVHVSPEA